ncbi:MAG: DUF309 domain-containing protein [Deltaproteobacteria bacterium]|nr:DUF309 domain-containing protein [Deltaproteobacteria bacterium]
MAQNEQDPRFYKAIDEFNQRLFFESHETLEELWLEENGAEKLFYQGIIQIAAGYFKWEQGVLIGAIKLLHAGLDKIEPYRPAYLGLELDSFVLDVKANLREIESAYRKKEQAPEIIVPVLSLIS